MIYILPIHEKVRPQSQPFRYPEHNDDYSVEQDFFNFIHQHPELTTNNPKKARFHYLPVFWWRWHLSHNFGSINLDELKMAVDHAILDDAKTFTICQYDDGPMLDLGKTILFLASRKTSQGIDIPLLCTANLKPDLLPDKIYTASFVGTFATHPIRKQLAEACANRADFFIRDGNFGTEFFLKTLHQSYISLCPRGYGGSSFRFFQSLQQGIVPFFIGDIDTRPFKNYIHWEEYSFYAKTPDHLPNLIDAISREHLLEMGKKGALLWENHLTYGKWIHYLLKSLTDLKQD